MALIKCTECGQMISDKAEICPNCGAPIEKKIICKECGMEISEMTQVCPNCGCPNPFAITLNQIPINIDYEKRVQRFLVINKNYLPQNRLQEIRVMLLKLTDDQWDSIECISFKDPTLLLILSVLVGMLGIDRFVLGDILNGVLKLLLSIACGIGLIWWIVDIFKINGLVLNYNYRLLKETLRYV